VFLSVVNRNAVKVYEVEVYFHVFITSAVGEIVGFIA